MQIKLAPQSIEALAYIISGGSNNDGRPVIGIYRSGPKIEQFMRTCGVFMSVGNSSRYPTLVNALIDATSREDADKVLKTIIERAADPRDFVECPEKLVNVITYLNKYLAFDGLELQQQGTSVRLFRAGTSSAVIEALSATVATLDFDTVRRDLDRALTSAECDPEDAVTSACSVIESVCRSILVELSLPLPEKKDIQSLYKAVRGPLGLSPKKDGVRDEIAEDVRMILGGLNSAIQGIGALRTHGGDAHGRERGHKRFTDARIARLAIHSASAAALFLIETWQLRFPAKTLHEH